MTQPTRPVLGHLTTSWTPPSTCFSVRVLGTASPWDKGYLGQTCNAADVFKLSDATDCWPPRTANAPHPTMPSFSGWGFYSPGTLCPSGFTTACLATYGESVSDWSLQFPLTLGETAAGCCPSGGYRCYNIVSVDGDSETYRPVQTCRLLETSTTIGVAPCALVMDGDAAFSAVVPYTVTNIVGSMTTTDTVEVLPISAPLIQINWRVDDLTTTIPTSTSSSSTSTSTGQGGNLSGGAIAGIFAGVIFGIVFALAGIAFAITSITGRRRMGCKKVGRNKKDPDAVPAQELMPSTRNRVRFAEINYYIPPQAPGSS